VVAHNFVTHQFANYYVSTFLRDAGIARRIAAKCSGDNDDEFPFEPRAAPASPEHQISYQ
jgi:hypothetical protein